MDADFGGPGRRSGTGRRPPSRVVVGWAVTAIVIAGLLVGLVWLFVDGWATRGETIDGRPPRRGWRRRRAATAHRSPRSRGGRVDRVGPSRWSRAAEQEAAAVAAFEQLRSELLDLGAPEELVRRAVSAAADERRHAERCRAIACTAGESPVPDIGAVRLDTPWSWRSRAGRRVRIAQIALESHLDGSMNERRAADRMRESAATSAAPVGPLLAAIADDEERHAQLADDIVAWARREGGRLTAVSLALVRSR